MSQQNPAPAPSSAPTTQKAPSPNATTVVYCGPGTAKPFPRAWQIVLGLFLLGIVAGLAGLVWSQVSLSDEVVEAQEEAALQEDLDLESSVSEAPAAPPPPAAPERAKGELKTISHKDCTLAQVLVDGNKLRYNPDCSRLIYQD